ncbi:MAG TPA: adenylate/guanylate cyclase domain-containing protein [Dongiaceae bacterium]|nr:adenylate/guanylate cyclase domain-containing protein [Dongiaceae bacterium]
MAIEIIEWLSSDDCHALDVSGLIDALAARLCAGGLQIQRLVIYLRPLHPTILGRAIAWAPGEPVSVLDIEHGHDQSGHIPNNPVLHVMATRNWLTLRLDDPQWTPHHIFIGRRLTELCIAPMIHGTSDRAVSAVIFGTQQQEGFSTADLGLMRRILPALRSAIELRMWRRRTETILETYIGSDPERHILAGRIRRGDAETLEAALMFCDMHGFTELSNRLSSERVLQVLNIYFDQVVPPVTQCGGQILKFMGDGVLAFFRDEAGAAQSCAAAFKAANLIAERLSALSVPGAKIEAGIGLHYGEVSYGNIGSGNRLDYTVIGRDVNLTSRIQGLCGPTSHPLLMSKRFTDLLAVSGVGSIGCHAVKGFAEPIQLFAGTI